MITKLIPRSILLEKPKYPQYFPFTFDFEVYESAHLWLRADLALVAASVAGVNIAALKKEEVLTQI